MTLPPGWVADVGKPYGDRGSGLHFGWNCKEGVSFTRFGAKQGDQGLSVELQAMKVTLALVRAPPSAPS